MTVNHLFKVNPVLIFNLLFNILVLYYIKNYLVTDNLIFSFYSEQLTYSQIEEFVLYSKKWEWAMYGFSTFLYLLKISTITLCVFGGLFMFGISDSTLSKIFSIVLKADIIFFIPQVIKLIRFTIVENYTLSDIQNYFPFALNNFIELSPNELWLLYPLQSVNIFEIGFFIILAFLLKNEVKKTMTDSIKIIAASYGSCFLLWIVFVVFIQLNFSS